MDEPGPPNDAKTCKTCKSSIHIKASKCPRCHAYQGIWHFLIVGTIACLFLVPIAGIVTLVVVDRMHRFDQRIEVVYSPDISILESRLYFAPSADFSNNDVSQMCPTIVGRLTNNDKRSYTSIEFRVELLNDDGELIDYFSGSSYGDFRTDHEYAFKLIGDPLHLPESEYKLHRIVASHAGHYIE